MLLRGREGPRPEMLTDIFPGLGGRVVRQEVEVFLESQTKRGH